VAKESADNLKVRKSGTGDQEHPILQAAAYDGISVKKIIELP